MSLLKDAWDALRKVADLVARFERQEREIERLQERCRKLEVDLGVVRYVLDRMPLPRQPSALPPPAKGGE